MALKPGTKLGRYRVDGLLGQGGMGVVYRGYDEDLGRAVALKVMLGSDPTARARFQREARIASQFTHPNAATVFDVGEADGMPFIVMELIDGETLLVAADALSPGGASKSTAERARWLVDAGRALEAAHAARLIHRDVKPQNVMITRSGTVKLLDFGIARRIESENQDGSAPTDVALGTLTQDGGLVGSVAYMAPEQISGAPLDGRADQFAWAVMTHEVLTGKPVWAVTSTVFAIAAEILNGDPAIDTKLSAPIARFLRRCLAKNRDDRFSTMSEAIAAFEAAVAERVPSPIAVGASLGEIPTSEWVGGLAAAPGSAPLGSAAAVSQVAIEASTLPTIEPAAKAAPSTQARTRALGPWLAFGVVVATAGVIFAATRHSGQAPPLPPSGSPSISGAPTTVAPPASAGAANAAPTASTPAPTEALVVKCKEGLKPDCGAADQVRWCLDPDQPLVCCSKGLVATPAGRCTCPDGGTREKAAVAQGCREPEPKYTESIQTLVRAHFVDLRACYSKALERNPKLGGKLSLSFHLTNHGTPTGVGIGGSSIPDVAFQDCAVGVIQALVFKPPPEGFTSVSYPIAFGPGD